MLLRQQDISKAQAEFDQELKLNPGCSVARLGLVATRLVQGDADGALKGLVALWHADRGFLQENLPLLREGLSENQREQLLRMVEDLQAREFTRPPNPGMRLTRNQRPGHFIRSGQYQKCSESLQPRLSALSAPSLLLLTQCAFYTGDYRTASLAARRLKSTTATRVDGLYWESKANQKLAITALTRAGETGSNSPQLHILLGDIYRQKQRWDDAENEYRKALALESSNQSASLGLAMALFSEGKNDEALAIDKALLARSTG